MKMSLQHIAFNHVHKRIVLQLVIFAIASIVLFAIAGNDVMGGSIGMGWVIASIIVGFFIGLLIGRMFLITWHQDTQKVIMSMDKLSVFLLVVYIAFRLFAKQIFGQYLSGQELTDITFCSLVGILIGRMVSMLRSINNILKEQKIIH